MRHYFIDQGHSPSDYFDININYDNHNFNLVSCDDIFSKNELDTGTQTLINTVLKTADLTNLNVLDMGCGYGAIGIIMAYLCRSAHFDMCDVNPLAVSLSTINKQRYKLDNITNIFVSDKYINVTKTYDVIITNPPIKAGKQTLMDILIDARDHLKENGRLYFVIRKDKGMQSVKDKLTTIYTSCEILQRNKGHYVLMCTK